MYIERERLSLSLLYIERERICLVVNDLPSAESKGAVPVRRGPPSECARAHLAPDKGYNTHSTLWCTPQPWRSPPSRRFWLGQFIALAFILSRCHVCGSEVVLSSVGVLSCRAFLFVTRDGAGARRMFQDSYLLTSLLSLSDLLSTRQNGACAMSLVRSERCRV